MELNLNNEVHEKSCGIIVFRYMKGKRLYLLLQHPFGHWGLAKGHVEKGETEIQTAFREVQEETGLSDIELYDGYKEQISFDFYVEQKHVFMDVVFFLGETKTKKITISTREHQNFVWLPYKEAYEKTTFLNAKELIEKAEKFFSMQRSVGK